MCAPIPFSSSTLLQPALALLNIARACPAAEALALAHARKRLETAMFCWSEASCKERFVNHLYWMSSTDWSPTMAQGGVFATDGSSLWGTANRVYLKYCA